MQNYLGLRGYFLETINDLSTRLSGEVGKFDVYIARLCLEPNKYKQMNTKDDHDSKGAHVQEEIDS